MLLTTRDFTAGDVPFTVNFFQEMHHIVAGLETKTPGYDVLVSGLSGAWKLHPVALLESLVSHQSFAVGEFWTFDFEEKPGHVLLVEDEAELLVPLPFMTDVVRRMATLHIGLAGEGHFPWLERLSPEARLLVA